MFILFTFIIIVVLIFIIVIVKSLSTIVIGRNRIQYSADTGINISSAAV
ncbi:pilus assembly protein TadG-related protein [Psychrobacter sp.]|uniref:Pilus assembly protein TadG-related protein n=1 Tax=Psychrobacter glacincola TaxID=56810 RepID=A0ABW1W9N8_9GAMM